MNNTFLTGALVIATLILGVAVYLKPEVQVVTKDGDNVTIGAASGPEHTERQSFSAGYSSGGRIATTTTAATYTLTAKDFVGTPTYIDILPNLNTTLSLSATSTFAYVPNVGDVAKIYVRNASSTAAATITLAAVDAGLDLQKNEDTADLAIAGLDWAELTIIRESANLTTVLFAEFIEAD